MVGVRLRLVCAYFSSPRLRRYYRQ